MLFICWVFFFLLGYSLAIMLCLLAVQLLELILIPKRHVSLVSTILEFVCKAAFKST